MISDLLFQCIFIFGFHFIPRSLGIIFGQSSSQILCAMVLNIGSVVRLAITTCFLFLHVTKFPPRIIQNIEVDLQSTIDLT